MLKNISLRMRLTLITAMILTCMSAVLTAFSVYNADFSFVQPLSVKAVPAAPYAESSDQGEKEQIIDTEASVQAIAATGVGIFQVNSILFMGVVIVAGSFLVYFVAGFALKPVKSLRMQINSIEEKDIDKRVSGFHAKDEINQLADSFNYMMDRLEGAFAQEKRFSSDAAHELKTPLTVLKTNLQILALDSQPTQEAYQKTIAVIQKQTDRMTHLVDDLFSMASADEYALEDIVRIDEIFLDIEADLRPIMEEKKIRFSLASFSCKVRANREMLLRAFSNMIENAIKYNVIGGSIEISFHKNDGYCIICISDTGIGIPGEQSQHIFEPFYRADTSRSRSIGGAGLGLAITKSIIEHHGGTIRYLPGNTPKSLAAFPGPRKNAGSTFEIVLPVCK